MNLHFFEDVEVEFSKAVFYYEDRQPDLGKRFRDEIANVLSRIIQDPFLCERTKGRVSKGQFTCFQPLQCLHY